MDDQEKRSFEGVHERLTQIVDEVSAEDISLDDALKLYEEAVKLGLSACDLSEQDIDAYLGTEGESGADEAAEASSVGAVDGGSSVMMEEQGSADSTDGAETASAGASA